MIMDFLWLYGLFSTDLSFSDFISSELSSITETVLRLNALILAAASSRSFYNDYASESSSSSMVYSKTESNFMNSVSFSSSLTLIDRALTLAIAASA